METNESNKKFSSIVKKLVEKDLSTKERLPEFLDSVEVDVRETSNGRACFIYFLFSESISGYDEYIMRPTSIAIKRHIRNLFGYIFKGGVFTYFKTYDEYNKKDTISENNKKEDLLKKIIINYLDENYIPDFGWEASFYKKEIETWGFIEYDVNDFTEYLYWGKPSPRNKYGAKTLQISSVISKDLNTRFPSIWVDAFVEWFEKNTGLEVETVTRSLGTHYND